MDVIFEEKHSGKGIVRSVCKSKDRPKWSMIVEDNQYKDDRIKFSSWFSIYQMFKEVFLPRGYPDSVSSDYLSYQIWDSLQAFGSSITGTLATHNVLKGIGVGDQSATVTSATLTWLLKDGTGMIGRIVFTYFKGSNLDVDCKKWRLYADISNDFAIGLDMICPMFPNYLLLLQCSSGLIKSLVGTIGGATRAALTQHQARNNNLADVSAKDSSQETLVNLVALITSLILVPLVAESDSLVWILFVIFTITHIYCNYRAVRSVKMEIFNPSRWTSFIEKYIFKETIGSVDEINQLENIWFFSTHQFQDRIESGLPLSDHDLSDEQFDRLNENLHNNNYILSVNGQHNVLISFFDGQESVRTKMEAYFHGNLILFALTDQKKAQSLGITINDHEELKLDSIVKSTRSIVDSKFDQMLTNAMDKGWNLSNFIFLENGWRVKSRDSRISDKKSN
ncbi:RUS family member 1-like [Panonychus citri]|uniref:RUS family member 1-like n=1 Tax=Panonychus citri TaxID=50023 RepID=UPI002308364E|nr:RUS family member 1-like [Panonychus citri]